MSKKKKPASPKPPKKKRNRVTRFIVSCFTLSLRTVLFTIMFLFCLAAGLWVLLMNFINAQQISEELTKRLEQTFNRPVIISSLDLKFFNMVELKGFSVLDTEVGFGEPFLSAESVTIRYNLFALLDRKLIIDEVTLNKPRINILRAEDGRYNVPEIKLPQGGTPSFVPAGRSSDEKIEISIEDWTIRDGILSYRDLGTGVSHALYELNLYFEKLRFNELSRFKLDTVLRNRWQDNISDLEIRGTGHVNLANFRWNDFALRSFKTQVALFRKPVSLTLDLDNLSTPFFNIKATVPAFEKKDLSLFSGNANLPEFKMPSATVTARGVVDNSYRRIRLNEGTISASDVKMTVSGAADFADKPALDFNIKTNAFSLKGKQQHLPLIKRYDLTGTLSGDAKITRQNGKLALNEVNLVGKKVSGDIYGFLAKEIDAEFTAKKDFTDLYVKTTGGQVVINNTTFDKLNLTSTYRRGNVYGHISSAEVNKVPIKLSLTISNIKKANRKIQTTIYWKHLNPIDFVNTVRDFIDVIVDIAKSTPGKKKAAPTPMETGDLSWLRNFRDHLPDFMSNFSGNLYSDTFTTPVISGTHFNTEFAFTGFLPGVKRLSGSLDIRLQDGVVHRMEQLAEEQQALNITFTPFLIMHRMERSGAFKVGEVLKDVPFTDLAVSTDFRDGLMGINNAYIQGPTISAAVSGWVYWVQETLELTIWTMFTKTSRSGALAENLTDESGNPALAFKVSGPMLKTKVEMLRAKKAGGQIEQARLRGLRTEFKTSQDFIKGDFNAKK